MSFWARFQPEAWINDYAEPIDGAIGWDCTKFILDPEGSSQELWHRAVGLNEEGDWFVDNDDELRADPAAPSEIFEHRGPFTITVTRVGEAFS